MAWRRDEIGADWLLVRWRPTRGLRAAIFYGLAAALPIGLRSTVAVHPRSLVSIRPGATITVWPRTTVSIWPRCAVTFAGSTHLVAIARACRATEISLGRPANVAALAADVWPTLWLRLEAWARTRPGHHHSQPLSSFLGQLVAHSGISAGAGNGGIGFQLGDLHGFLPDQHFIGLVGQRRFGDFAAEAHHLLGRFPRDVLIGFKEAAQGHALVFVQVLKHLLRIEPAPLTFHGSELAALAVGWSGLTARGLIPADFFAAGLLAADVVRSGIAPGTLVALEITPGRTLALNGAFVARTVLAGAVLGKGGLR